MEWRIICASAYLALVCFIIYILAGKRRTRRPSPTAPRMLTGIPLLGILPSVQPPLYRYLTSLSETHGNVFGIRIGLREVVVVNDFLSLTRLGGGGGAITDHDRLQGWVSGLSRLEDEKRLGVSERDGEVATQGGLISRMLHDFMCQEARLVEVVQFECHHFLEGIGKVKKDFSDFSTFTAFHFFNVIFRLLTGRRFSQGDSQYQSLRGALNAGARSRKLLSLLYMMFPALDRLTLVSRFVLWRLSRSRVHVQLTGMFAEHMEERSRAPALQTEPRDMIEQFLASQRLLEADQCDQRPLVADQCDQRPLVADQCDQRPLVADQCDQQRARHGLVSAPLLVHTLQFLTSELEVVSQIMERGLLLMIRHPQVQAQVHREIVGVVGKDRMPCLEDRKCLPYTQAVMDEILRVSSSILMETFYTAPPTGPLTGNLPVSPSRLVLINVHGCNTDPKVWQHPFDFYPDHFLCRTESNELVYSPRDELLFHALDRRHFFQESLTKIEYYIFFTSILHKFQVCCGPDGGRHSKLDKAEWPFIKNFIFKSVH